MLHDLLLCISNPPDAHTYSVKSLEAGGGGTGLSDDATFFVTMFLPLTSLAPSLDCYRMAVQLLLLLPVRWWGCKQQGKGRLEVSVNYLEPRGE